MYIIISFFLFFPPLLFANSHPLYQQVRLGHCTFMLEVVSLPSDMSKGLSGRQRLPSNHGMLFHYTEPGVHKIWMKGMLFSLDVIWLYRGRVTSIKQNLLPKKKGGYLSVYAGYGDRIIEVSGGTVKRCAISLKETVL